MSLIQQKLMDRKLHLFDNRIDTESPGPNICIRQELEILQHFFT